MFNAASVLGGVASQMNPLGYASQATNTGNSAFNMATQIQNQSLWQTLGQNFMGSLGKSLGKGLGSLGTGGISCAAAALGNMSNEPTVQYNSQTETDPSIASLAGFGSVNGK